MYCTFFALQQHYTMLNSQILHKSVRHFYQTNGFKNINKSIFEYSCEIFIVILQWKIIFPNLQNGKQIPRLKLPLEIRLRYCRLPKLQGCFVSVQDCIGSKLMLSTDSSSYLQIQENKHLIPCPTPHKHPTNEAITDSSFQHFLS